MHAGFWLTVWSITLALHNNGFAISKSLDLSNTGKCKSPPDSCPMPIRPDIHGTVLSLPMHRDGCAHWIVCSDHEDYEIQAEVSLTNTTNGTCATDGIAIKDFVTILVDGTGERSYCGIDHPHGHVCKRARDLTGPLNLIAKRTLEMWTAYDDRYGTINNYVCLVVKLVPKSTGTSSLMEYIKSWSGIAACVALILGLISWAILRRRRALVAARNPVEGHELETLDHTLELETLDHSLYHTASDQSAAVKEQDHPDGTPDDDSAIRTMTESQGVVVQPADSDLGALIEIDRDQSARIV